MTEFEESLYSALASIPKGKVISYGKLAALSGYPGNARHVGKTLGKLPKETKLAWFRVVNSQGKISLTGDSFLRQKKLLNDEGVTVNENGRIENFRHLLWM